MEYDVGAISGMTPEEIRQKHPEVIAARQRGERPAFPGEEGRAAFHVRVRGVIDRVRATDQAVVVVAHGGVIGAVCQIALGIDSGRRGLFEIANCSITQITEDRLGNLVILHHNDVCHLANLVTRADRG
jgi:broad specificity phosphatase PhoE